MSSLRNTFRLLTDNQKAVFLRNLSKKEQKAFLENPDLFLYPKQVIEGKERYILLRCGRRFGKSYAGGAYIAKRIYQGARTLGLCGPIYNDIKNIMAPSIMRWFYGKDKPRYNNLRKCLEFDKKSRFHGVLIHCFTSDKEIRGYSLEALWCDEVGAWLGSNEQIKRRFYSVDTCVSEGKLPQTIITTTPITIPLFHEWKRAIDAGDKRFKLITGTMFDNPYLTSEYKEAEVKKYGNTRLGRQELFGELLEELEGALFTKKLINDKRCAAEPYENYDKIVIAVDPAMTSNEESDETGIIIIGKKEENATVLADLSGRFTPKEWSDVVAKAFKDYKASYIIAERNAGGDLVKSNLTASHFELDPYIKLIFAKKSKMLRAEPVSNVFEDGRIFFAGTFEELEKQMVEYVGTGSSPDRLDAFVYGITELLIKNQDLDVFKSLQKSADNKMPKIALDQRPFVYSLGIDLRPNNTSFVLAAYNKYTGVEHNIYILDFLSAPMNLHQVITKCREIMTEKTPINIVVSPADMIPELRKFAIPAKASEANDALIEAINSDILNNRVQVCNDLFLPFSRLLKTLQYDGESLEKTGRFVLMQDDSFLSALLNSFSKSNHIVHKIADKKHLSRVDQLLSSLRAAKDTDAKENDTLFFGE